MGLVDLGVKLWELWRDRFRVDVGSNLHSLPENGNTIYVRNLGGRRIILTYWELLWLSGYWPFRRKRTFEFAQDPSDEHIEPLDSVPLEFRDAQHFSWGANALQGKKIYLRLYFAGKKRAVVRKIVG